MERLVKDAAKIDKSIDSNSLSYSNVVKAIHTMQEELGIAGTTSKEAASTIQGSWSSLKASWSNLMKSLVVGGDDFDQCLDNLIDSAMKFKDNIMPALEKALTGIGTLVEKIAPSIEQYLPVLIDELLPPLLKAAVALVKGVIKALPKIIMTVIKELPSIAVELAKAVGELFFGSSNGLLESVVKFASGFVAVLGIFEMIKKIVSKFQGAFSIFDKIGGIAESTGSSGVMESIKNFFDGLAKINTNTILKGMANLAIIIGGATAIAAAVMAISPYMDKLTDVNSLVKTIGSIAAISAVGLGLAEITQLAAKIPISSVIKGLSNIAITIGGLSIVYLAIGGLSLIDFDYNKMFEIIKIIGLLGVFGGVLTGFAAIVGLIPIPVVLLGLANIAVAISGMSVVYLAIGALSLIDFNYGKMDEIIKITGLLGVFGGVLAGFAGLVGMIPMPVVLLGLANIAIAIGGLKVIANAISQSNVDGIVSFFYKVASIPDQGFINARALFQSLSEISDLPKKGGLLNWVKGESSLAAVGEDIKQFGENVAAFFYQINGLNIDNLNALWDSLKRPEEITKNLSSLLDKSISDIVDKIKKLPEQMGNGIRSGAKNLSDSLVYIWQEAAKAMANPVNKIIEGANWVLKEFGSDKTIASWTPYARGTDGHQGGNALVNDGRGAELVQMPNGRTFLPQGRNVFIPNAPKGMKVLPAGQTANLLGEKTPTFHYATGTGGFDIWSYIDNEKGLVDEIAKGVSYDGMSGFVLSASKGMINMITEEMTGWGKKLFDEFGAKGIGDYVASAGVEQWRTTVAQALQMEGQYSPENVERTLYQMQTESGGNPTAINNWDSNAAKGTPSKGLMQVIDPTFRSYARPGFNSNIYDPLSNILASIRYAVSRYGSLARAYQGHGYSNGGLVTKPGWIGEEDKEMVIPLASNKRNRALDLWEKTGELLGVGYEDSPTSGGSYSYENNNYSPVFNLTINGVENDRNMQRKIKQWINDSMNEMIESLERKNPTLREI